MSYAETFANLYQYEVKPAYNINAIMAVWSCISIIFFTGAVVVYKKTDFK